MIVTTNKIVLPALLFLLIVTGCSRVSSGATKPSTGGSSPKPGGATAGGKKDEGAKSGSNSSSSADGKPDKSSEGGAQPNDVVKIPLDDQRRAGIQTSLVLVQRVPRSLSVAGQVAMDEQHTSHLGTISDGRITAVNVLPGASVRRGQMLGSLHGHAVHETVGALIQAFAAVNRQLGAVTFARQASDRYSHLYSIQAASLEESQRASQDLQQAEQMLVDARSNVRMEREHLSELLQVAPESLTPENLYDKELIPIRSPIDGVIVTRNISVGQVVDLGFDAFDITNLSTVWVTASVNQQDLALIKIGALAEVLDSASPDRVIAGRVTMLGDTIDPLTRTAPVRIVVSNPDTHLRPGMFVTAHITEPATRDAVFVPEDALQEINGLQVVFVTSDGQTFQARTVSLGTRSQAKVEVVGGLRPGDRIVVSGAFMVKAEMLKGTMGGG
jgi:cobalt-zinc-cadmium efflux system membrane fusion protein